MDLIQRLDNVHICLLENDLTIPMYIRGVLTVPSSFHVIRENLLFNAEGICSDLSKHDTSDSVFLWAFEMVKTKLCRELVSLTHQKMGLHFNASILNFCSTIVRNSVSEGTANFKLDIGDDVTVKSPLKKMPFVPTQPHCQVVPVAEAG
jgi:hypothetical protein